MLVLGDWCKVESPKGSGEFIPMFVPDVEIKRKDMRPEDDYRETLGFCDSLTVIRNGFAVGWIQRLWTMP